jgi:hypothetical protein
MSWLRKSIYGVIGAVLTGLVSYTVERVKGTPPRRACCAAQILMGVTLYELTTHGRNWVLDQINRQARELDSAPSE